MGSWKRDASQAQDDGVTSWGMSIKLETGTEADEGRESEMDIELEGEVATCVSRRAFDLTRV